MSRTLGSLDADYELKKARLRESLCHRLGNIKGSHPSYRDLAAAAGVSQTTLRHYFGSMDDLIVAIFAGFLQNGLPHIEVLSKPTGSFKKSIRDAVEHLAYGMRLPALRALRSIGQAEGVRRSRAGEAYLLSFIDPCITAIQKRLEWHVRTGDMRKCDCRSASISLVAPIVFVFQHQDELGGSKCSPLIIQKFLQHHTEGFVRAYRS